VLPFLAGQAMIARGWFHPAITPNAAILDYWPGFLTGGVIGAVVVQCLAYMLRCMLFNTDD